MSFRPVVNLPFNGYAISSLGMPFCELRLKDLPKLILREERIS